MVTLNHRCYIINLLPEFYILLKTCYNKTAKCRTQVVNPNTLRGPTATKTVDIDRLGRQLNERRFASDISNGSKFL